MPEHPDAPTRGAKYRIAYENELNASQLEAVFYRQGPLLVIAGAGSGKTRTITYRVARLVEEGVDAAKILLLTFTRKASSEMLNRASHLLDQRCQKVSGGTFHSFAYYLLRQYAARIGFAGGFTIIDRGDAESLVGMVRSEITSNQKLKSFPRKQTLLNIFSRSVNKAKTIEEVVFDDFPHFQPHLPAIIDIFQQYRNRKQQHGFLDYDDLLVFAFRLLADHEDIRDRISSSYQFVMVDEYQDTNLLQADMLYLVADRQHNVMAVGDDSQSIYAFRGANFRNIIDFPVKFPNTRIISLEENYRSVQPILDLTNSIIQQATVKYEKRLFTRQQQGSKPILVNTGSENNQSLFIVDRILALKQRGIELKRIAVLFRASFHSFDLEIELTRAQIPFVKVGGFKFIDSAHIKDVLAHLRVIAHPNDRISWYRLLMLLEGIGPKSALSIFEAIVAQQAGYAGIFSAAATLRQTPALERLKSLFTAIDLKPMTVGQMGETVIRYYEPILKERFDDYPKRTRDLDHLLTIMERYEGVEEFLTDMALEPPNTSADSGLAGPETEEDRVVLSTIHSAKGLEWHTVFIIWGLDGRFPSVYVLDNPEDIEEELRLMYVAATRAQRNLYITYPSQVYDRSTGMVLSQPSRFVGGISEDVLVRQHLVEW